MESGQPDDDIDHAARQLSMLARPTLHVGTAIPGAVPKLRLRKKSGSSVPRAGTMSSDYVCFVLASVSASFSVALL